MAGSSEPDELRRAGWLDAAQVVARVNEPRGGFSGRQLERWREAGIVSARKWPLPGGGRVALYAPDAPARLRAAIASSEHSLEGKRWDVWWLGFDLPEEVWRADLSASFASYGEALKVAVRLMDAEDIAAELAAIAGVTRPAAPQVERASGGILKVLRRVADAEQRLGFVQTALEVSTGHFIGVGEEDDDTQLPRSIALRVLDAEVGRNHAVLGAKLLLSDAIDDSFRAIARWHEGGAAIPVSSAALLRARDDARHALSIAADLYEATSWIFGPGAFGLRMAANLATARRELKAGLVIGLAALRAQGLKTYSSAQLREMARQASEIKQKSLDLKVLSERRRYRKMLSPQALKRAFSSSLELKRLRDRIASSGVLPHEM